jgi:prepilin-type N-terminal cleavage/methylation domain-containing protein
MVYLKHMEGGPSVSGQSIRVWRRVRRFLAAPKQDGFTMVEVLIVLAVTGALFVSAAILISGRQNQTAFDQSIRQIQSQIQQTMNEVAVGYYPNREDFRCTAGGAGPVLDSVATAQGSNSGCIFLGKALQFKVGTTDPEQFVVYTIAGLQKGAAGGAESQNFTDARPMVVAPSTSHNGAGYPNNSISDDLQNGLTTARMWYNNGGGDVNIGAVAFVNSLQRQGSGSVLSGTGEVQVVPVNNTALGSTPEQTVELMNVDGTGGNRLATSPVDPSEGVFICFTSGGTNQWGIVRIGGDNRALSITLRIKEQTGGTCTY